MIIECKLYFKNYDNNENELTPWIKINNNLNEKMKEKIEKSFMLDSISANSISTMPYLFISFNSSWGNSWNERIKRIWQGWKVYALSSL